MDKKTIGYNFKKKREEKNWSQEEFAHKAGITSAYIGMIERGEKVPRLETFVRLANLLGATADELLEGVIDRGFEIRVTKYTEKIQKLSKEERNRIYKVLNVMLEEE